MFGLGQADDCNRELKWGGSGTEGQTFGPQEKHSLLRLLALTIFIDLF